MTATQHRVVFDDTCLFCQRSIRLLKKMDWLNRFSCIGQSTLTPAPSDPKSLRQNTLRLLPPAPPSTTPIPLNTTQLSQSIHIVTSTNHILQGADAVRFIGLRLPLSAPLSCLLFLPGAMPLTALLYRWISRNRHQLAPCKPKDSCRLP
ncbi:MAG: thiol-disulfide oxidoreductase DCC family protein [Limisphaerales bacterium]